MGTAFRLAKILSRSPLHPAARWLARKLDRYMDLCENYNNSDPETNGEMFLVRKAARHWNVAFDIGANIGEWTEAVTASNPRCEVYCFEASPLVFERLQQRMGPLATVKLYPLGMSSAEGELAFHDYGADTGLSGFVSREGSVGLKPKRVITVPTTSVDRFMESQRLERVDFIKIDAEGSEMPILRGMSDTLARKAVSCLQFEYGGTWIDAGETLCNANNLLREHGYELFRMLPGGLRRVLYDHRRDESFKYANFIAAADLAILEKWGIPR